MERREVSKEGEKGERSRRTAEGNWACGKNKLRKLDRKNMIKCVNEVEKKGGKGRNEQR